MKRENYADLLASVVSLCPLFYGPDKIPDLRKVLFFPPLPQARAEIYHIPFAFDIILAWVMFLLVVLKRAKAT